MSVVFSVMIRWTASSAYSALQIAYLAEEFADAGALGEDLGMSGLEALFGVRGSLAPGCFSPVVLHGEHLGLSFTGFRPAAP
ncbi:hypothetical protein [Streptomyces sp. NPDC051662]|uniref:hypothetical protein n=1 Tax=Streptomyces sp. NPDC051662 TaxID=3154750 RepID=UPI00341B2A58